MTFPGVRLASHDLNTKCHMSRAHSGRNCAHITSYFLLFSLWILLGGGEVVPQLIQGKMILSLLGIFTLYICDYVAK
jgi:hypothetical protein